MFLSNKSITEELKGCKCGCKGNLVEHNKWQEEVKKHRQWIQQQIEDGEF